ncbi:MAG TPA: prolyl oligopeptidase family serine peptidase [Thermoanaerobaculaceae bacterium]|nr:prolyl oligopeptidase family serine peptidase [Thermoanaerobaculaceae bacterium]
MATLAAAAALGLAGRSVAAAPAPPSTFSEVVVQPGDRRLTVALPAGFTTAAPSPLVVVLHYAGTVTPFSGKNVLALLVEPALRDLGAVMVAPDCPAADWTAAAAEDAVLGAVEYAKRTFKIDPARTLITGYSMGGTGAWFLAARHQDLFRAALIVSGRPLARADEIEWRIPLEVIHSRDDERIPLKPTADAVAAMRARGADVRLEVVDGLTHYQVAGFVRYLRAAVPWVRSAWGR